MQFHLHKWGKWEYLKTITYYGDGFGNDTMFPVKRVAIEQCKCEICGKTRTHRYNLG